MPSTNGQRYPEHMHDQLQANIDEHGWAVVAVVATPGGNGGRELIFAYTVGLTEKGLPELVLTSEHDPGQDHDGEVQAITWYLNRIARQGVDGEIRLEHGVLVLDPEIGFAGSTLQQEDPADAGIACDRYGIAAVKTLRVVPMSEQSGAA